ncbi:hypothetical protein WJT74_01175 [Sphingomicrobium sp. XHP0239]|uniref:hypothetical protein n=1 Tax=Sphingomicrobium maritimum TaxID=3133972 RepID=UPI0031CC45B0
MEKSIQGLTEHFNEATETHDRKIESIRSNVEKLTTEIGSLEARLLSLKAEQEGGSSSPQKLLDELKNVQTQHRKLTKSLHIFEGHLRNLEGSG